MNTGTIFAKNDFFLWTRREIDIANKTHRPFEAITPYGTHITVYPGDRPEDVWYRHETETTTREQRSSH